MKDQIKLGELAPLDAKRDAIHIAVAPVIAFRSLTPGEHVGLNEDGKADNLTEKTIGVVDPFLKGRVQRDEKFYLFLYPGTITKLRHEWSHPAFTPETQPSPAPTTYDQLAVSEAWLRQYAKRVNNYMETEEAYETLMSDIRRRRITYHGTDMHSRGDLEDADELRHHASIVLGQQVDWGTFEHFSCTC